MFKKKVLPLVMVMCFVFSCSVVYVNAQNVTNGDIIEPIDYCPIATPMYISNATVSLTISNSGIATSTARITGFPGITTRVTITMTLQKRGGFLNLFWNDVATWSQSFNNHSGTLSQNISVGKGTYRVRASFTAFSANSSESNTIYSGTVTH